MTYHVTALKGGVRMNIAPTESEAEAREIAQAQSKVLGQRRWVLLVTECRASGQRTKVAAYRKGQEMSVAFATRTA